MSIPVSVNNGKASARADMERAPVVRNALPSNKVKDADSPASAMAQSRASLNSAIVQTSLNVAINAGNEPLALLYQAAINGINEVLQPELGKDAIQNGAGEDHSADATASRIVTLSTAFYNAYREQNKLEDNAESREKFVGVIRGGFEKGFKEAQHVLEGLKVLSADIASGIDRTYALVMQGFDDFAAGPRQPPVAEPLSRPLE